MNVIKIFRYLKGNKYYRIELNKNINIRVYADAVLDDDDVTRRSTTSFVIFMGSTPLTWYSQLQDCVATSTIECEYNHLN